jgi:hypothetical protein
VNQNAPPIAPIPPLGLVRIDTGEGNRFTQLGITWALVTASADLGVNLFFEYVASPVTNAVVNTIGFNAAPELTTATVPVELEPPPPGAGIGRTMGLAIANANNIQANVSLLLLDSKGKLLATHPITLGPNSQIAIDLSTLNDFSSVLPAGNFIGSLVISSDAPVASIALGDDFGPFSAVPVINGRP